MHLLTVVDSDNLFLPLPLTEIDIEQRMVVLPPQGRNVGEAYGREFEQPLLTTVAPASFASARPGQWVAGDLHIHTTYSHDSYGGPDDDNTGIEEGWTLGNTVTEQFAVAATRGLDFLAITDHNDVRSQSDPGFGAFGVVPVPAYENSLSGHAQMLGATTVYDKDRDGDGDVDAGDVQALADALRADGGVFQQNHPASDYTQRGELDLDQVDWGYGYEVVPDTLEVWNIAAYWQPPAPSGSSLDDALRYWNGYLDRGAQVAATGGSDNHYKATLAVQGPGQPTTWVYVDEVSTAGVLDGLAAGRTFVSHQPPALQGPQVFLEADADGDGDYEAMVGDTVAPGSAFRARVVGAPGATLRAITDGGAVAAEVAVSSADEVVALDVPEDATWVRTELVAEDGADLRAAVCDDLVGDQTTYCRNRLGLLALTSPIYVRDGGDGGGDEPAPTTLVYDGDTTAGPRDVTLAAMLTSGGAPVAGRPVTFDLDGAVYEAVTDAAGRASVTVPPTTRGRDQQVTVTFAGDADYAPATAHAVVRWDPSGRGGAAGAGGGSGVAAAGQSAAVRATASGAGMALLLLAVVLIGLVERKRQHVAASVQPTGR